MSKAVAESPRRQLANAIRALSMDAVQQANCGHPGMPMGMADIAEVLWNDFLKHNPQNPNWLDRDRFVLSNGHGSMLLYSLLHLSGYDLPISEIKNFRQLHSKTPGHPEYGYTPGVETTTGPLGQGLANAVGMALTERLLAAEFNQDGHEVIDHHTYVFMGDGCLMEGISHEAASLAGTLGLGKLIAVWDDNGISIDGEVDGWFTDDTVKRFEAYGWQVIAGVDGHDPEAIKDALSQARNNNDKPSLICCRTVIGFGSPNKAGTAGSHGAALGDAEIALTREKLGWSHTPFEIPAEIQKSWDARQRGQQAETTWQQRFDAYQSAHPQLAAELKRRIAGDLPKDWAEHAEAYIAATQEKSEKVASRKASQMALEAYAKHLPELIGGSADLTGSNLTNWSGSKTITRESAAGNYIYYGVREFGMAAIMNGMVLHGGVRPYGGTFLMFSEYARNALRMAALMKQPSIFVFTHDSVGLGEDGPTHQAVEQIATLRMMPRMSLWRPCDATETAVAWRYAIERKDGPTSLALSRQGLPAMARDSQQLKNIARGGYVLRDSGKTPEAILIATGSEVALALEAYEAMTKKGHSLRLVSMPSADLFDAQDQAYRESVLPKSVRARVAVEAGVGDYWRKYVGLDGDVMSIDSFGESAPADVLFEHFGFTNEKLVAKIELVLTR